MRDGLPPSGSQSSTAERGASFPSSTFAERYDLEGKTIFPVTTHAMSGLGTTPVDYASLCPGATIKPGLAVQGERARASEPMIEAWLRRVRLLPS